MELMVTNDSIYVGYRCGEQGSEWIAALEPAGDRFRFTSFRRQDGSERKETTYSGRRSELTERIRRLTASKAALPPPASIEIVPTERPTLLTTEQLSDFGFKCPACAENALLVCPYADCRKVSCRGAVDDAQRVLCQWCGRGIVFGGAVSSSEPSELRPIRFEATARNVEHRPRELAPGKQPPQLSAGK